MKSSQIRLCTVAIGDDYRAMARRLARDLLRYAPGRELVIGTDRVEDFRGAGNTSAFPVAARSRWGCYNAKRLALRKALKDADVAIHVDADSRIVASLPLHGHWAPGLTAPHERLIQHLERWWPSWIPIFDAAAAEIGATPGTAFWIGESIYALARDAGREFAFIEHWGRLAGLLAAEGFRGGEGNVMGLAAVKAGLPVQRGRWTELDAARRHLNASQARRLTPPGSGTILPYGQTSKAGKTPASGIRARDGSRTADRSGPPYGPGSPDGPDSADGPRTADGPGSPDGSGSPDRSRSPDRRVLTAAHPLISVVVVSRNEGDNLRRTVTRLAETLPARSEILVVDDASEDESAAFLTRRKAPARLIRANGLGVTSARNFGAKRTRGDVILFADAHVDAPDGWFEPMLESVAGAAVGAAAPGISVMGHPERVGYGLRIKGDDLSTHWLKKSRESPYPVPIAPGCFLAMRREIFEATSGFDEGMSRFGMSDVELGVRFWLLGYELHVVPSVVVAHLFRKRHPYEVRWRSFLHNRARLASVHFNEARIGAIMTSMREHREFPAALAMLAAGDAEERRRELLARRLHDDDWYFKRFEAGLEPIVKREIPPERG